MRPNAAGGSDDPGSANDQRTRRPEIEQFTDPHTLMLKYTQPLINSNQEASRPVPRREPLRYPPPAVPNARAEREFVMTGWGMPPPPRMGGSAVTDIRNTSSPALARLVEA
jgi:hypothetical protein